MSCVSYIGSEGELGAYSSLDGDAGVLGQTRRTPMCVYIHQCVYTPVCTYSVCVHKGMYLPHVCTVRPLRRSPGFRLQWEQLSTNGKNYLGYSALQEIKENLRWKRMIRKLKIRHHNQQEREEQRAAHEVQKPPKNWNTCRKLQARTFFIISLLPRGTN